MDIFVANMSAYLHILFIRCKMCISHDTCKNLHRITFKCNRFWSLGMGHQWFTPLNWFHKQVSIHFSYACSRWTNDEIPGEDKTHTHPNNFNACCENFVVAVCCLECFSNSFILFLVYWCRFSINTCCELQFSWRFLLSAKNMKVFFFFVPALSLADFSFTSVYFLFETISSGDAVIFYILWHKRPATISGYTHQDQENGKSLHASTIHFNCF